MENLTLTADELGRLKKGFALVFVAILFLAAVTQWQLFGASVVIATLRSVPASLFVVSALFYMFYRWAWRISWVARLMGRPVLYGVWLGNISSDYNRPNTGEPLVIPIVFVVRQTYLTISIQSFTEKQVGESKMEALIRNVRTDATRLGYVFELKTQYSGMNNLTNGAGDLSLLKEGSVLKGTYWTNSPTHGEIKLRLQSRETVDVKNFKDASDRWGDRQLWEID